MKSETEIKFLEGSNIGFAILRAITEAVTECGGEERDLLWLADRKSKARLAIGQLLVNRGKVTLRDSLEVIHDQSVSQGVRAKVLLELNDPGLAFQMLKLHCAIDRTYDFSWTICQTAVSIIKDDEVLKKIVIGEKETGFFCGEAISTEALRQMSDRAVGKFYEIACKLQNERDVGNLKRFVLHRLPDQMLEKLILDKLPKHKHEDHDHLMEWAMALIEDKKVLARLSKSTAPSYITESAKRELKNIDNGWHRQEKWYRDPK